MGAFFIIAFNAKNISNDFKEKIPITIYLRDNAKKTEIVQLQKKINLKNYTKSIKYISKEKGAEILIEEIEENFIEFLGTNPILNSIDIYLKSDFVKSDILDKIWIEFSGINFVDEVRKKFNETDTIMVMCRSGVRSAMSVDKLVKAGFKNVYNIVDGFEGNKIDIPESYNNGKRLVNGWKNSGAPWTYELDPNLVYHP